MTSSFVEWSNLLYANPRSQNYVGTLNSTSTKSVIATLKKVFPYIECYGEDQHQQLDTPQDQPTIYNMVFYASTTLIKFSLPSPYALPHNSTMYPTFLQKFPKHRVDLSKVEIGNEEGLVITDRRSPLERLQVESARAHWSVMREIFGWEFWGL